MNEAIKLAIEKGGYKYPSKPVIDASQAVLVCNPLFWQALGKALGWGETIDTHQGDRYDEIWTETTWLYHAHQYFDFGLNWR